MEKLLIKPPKHRLEKIDYKLIDENKGLFWNLFKQYGMDDNVIDLSYYLQFPINYFPWRINSISPIVINNLDIEISQDALEEFQDFYDIDVFTIINNFPRISGREKEKGNAFYCYPTGTEKIFQLNSSWFGYGSDKLMSKEEIIEFINIETRSPEQVVILLREFNKLLDIGMKEETYNFHQIRSCIADAIRDLFPKDDCFYEVNQNGWRHKKLKELCPCDNYEHGKSDHSEVKNWDETYIYYKYRDKDGDSRYRHFITIKNMETLKERYSYLEILAEIYVGLTREFRQDFDLDISHIHVLELFKFDRFDHIWEINTQEIEKKVKMRKKVNTGLMISAEDLQAILKNIRLIFKGYIELIKEKIYDQEKN